MKRFMRICSCVLVFVFMLNMLPMSVFAENMQANTDRVTAEAVPLETTQSVIVEEITQNRTEYSKQFILSNGLQMAVLYPDAVHYQKNGSWAEIDNTLTVKNGSYTNTDGVWNVRFPQKLDSGNSVVIEKDGYALSFAMSGELRNTGLEIAGFADMSMQQSATEAIAPETTEATAPETTEETISETTEVTVPETTADTLSETVAETVPEPTLDVVEQITVDSETLSVNKMQLSTANLVPVDTAAMREAAQYPEAVADKNLSRLSYQNVFSDTNIQYDLQSNTVKESIILKSYDPQLRGYRYTLNVGQLIPVLLDGGQIDFYDSARENIVMSMPAPYMVDAMGEYCSDVQVQLIGNGSAYTLTYLLAKDWLADSSRAWPVIVDPVISADLSRSNIEDRTVSQSNDNGEGWGMNACGYSAKYGVHRCYLQYLELPELTSSDVVIGAQVAQYKAFESSTITTVQVHKVTQSWRSNNIAWANKPSFNASIEDYAIVDDVAWYSWDVTDIVRGWYANGNTGMMFKASDAIETGGTDNFKQFLSENYGVAEYRPKPLKKS